MFTSSYTFHTHRFSTLHIYQTWSPLFSFSSLSLTTRGSTQHQSSYAWPSSFLSHIHSSYPFSPLIIPIATTRFTISSIQTHSPSPMHMDTSTHHTHHTLSLYTTCPSNPFFIPLLDSLLPPLHGHVMAIQTFANASTIPFHPSYSIIPPHAHLFTPYIQQTQHWFCKYIHRSINPWWISILNTWYSAVE